MDKRFQPSNKPPMLRIAFLAISQAHQFLHWLPAALRLAREPGVEVTVLGTSEAAANSALQRARQTLFQKGQTYFSDSEVTP